MSDPHHGHLSDEEILAGLWWDDPEYPAYAGELWREYVSKKHEWNKYRSAVAEVLRRTSVDEPKRLEGRIAAPGELL